MQIKNPSNNAINDVKIFGVSYSIEAEGTLDNVPESHARYWQESLHKFLILKKDKLEAKPEVEETIIPEPKVTEPEVIAEEVSVDTTDEVIPEVADEIVVETQDEVISKLPKITKGVKKNK